MIPQELNPKAQRIIRWRETLSTMNDDRFFEIMRVYLGEIHTPYNKDKLIELLSSIFRKDNTKETILAFLSDFDIKIITAISLINSCTQEKLIAFFKNEYQLSEIYSQLINLSERLIIYSYSDKELQENIISINPLLEETLAKIININTICPKPIFIEHNYNPPFYISPDFIAAFYSYVLENPAMCKNNGEIKKRDAERLSQIFSEHYECIPLLLKSFVNLGIIKLGEREISIDTNRFDVFSKLDEIKQYAYLAAASVTRLSRSSLQTQTQLLLNTIASIPNYGLSLPSVFRTAFLIKYQKEKTNDSPVQSRFSKLLEAHRNSSYDLVSDEIIEEILRNSIKFGLLQEIGKDEKENSIVLSGSIFTNQQNQNTEKKGIININAGTSIAILPGLKLSELIPITTFLNIVSFDTVCEFEISKKSIYRGFDKNLSTDEVLELLGKYNAYPIPQSLSMNIEEWHHSYSSAILYKGYVLKADEKTQRIIENNPKIASLINLKLAEGVYLLNIPFEQNADEFLANSGLEIFSEIKSPSSNSEAASFPIINTGKNHFPENTRIIKTEINENSEKAEKIKTEFLTYLESLNLSNQQYECLSTRIKKNIILTKEQIKAETVRLEILEADGMNFAGKIHLIENAISHQDMLEILIPEENNPSQMTKYFGKPLLITRQTNDSMLKMQLDDTDETKIFSVSRINHAKIIKTSVF